MGLWRGMKRLILHTLPVDQECSPRRKHPGWVIRMERVWGPGSPGCWAQDRQLWEESKYLRVAWEWRRGQSCMSRGQAKWEGSRPRLCLRRLCLPSQWKLYAALGWPPCREISGRMLLQVACRSALPWMRSPQRAHWPRHFGARGKLRPRAQVLLLPPCLLLSTRWSLH